MKSRMRGRKHTEASRLLRILRVVGFLVLLHSCTLGTAQMIFQGKMFVVIGGINATIGNPLNTITGCDAVLCADSCLWNGNCRVFSLETRPTTTVCQLGSNGSTIIKNPTGMSAAFYYDRNTVPPGYTFAMITDKMHFLKPFTVFMNYTTGLAACKADGANHLVQDDKGLTWHNFILQYAASNFAAPGTFWLGGDDLDRNHIYNWNDGTLVSASVQTFWESRQPDNSGPCIQLHWYHSGFHDLWDDFFCSQLFGVLCEVRLP
ncbi:unnamed protein product [Darwinula stevensoni]|uniref:C-type lectin domain-containing protein n=1 Tax=Darwinula stevensoni TaxID=69355 RepID=A0A7R9AFM6_9CRUS|nr:unnamed protein product [Darwinula stevensoni]CAG0903146.1 unnamed protein product [Darwinula stevensoni]